nr:MAG TPA: hypothetical protein [Caudoviricetes sp.]
MMNIPAGKTKNYYSIENFLGVDFSSSPLEVDKRRSPNSYNMTNKNGYLETRNGYELICKVGERINGIWNIDLIDKELNIVHSGNSLYEFSDDFKSSKKILTNLNDNLSTGIYLGGYLVIFDGKRTIIYHNTENGYKAEYVDEKGYIPTTSIARNSTGGGTDYEKINLMSPYRINMFLTEEIKTTLNGELQTGPQTVFKLDDENIDEVELVEVLTDGGNWNIITKYVVDKKLGQVTLLSAPGDSPVIGRDNVRIKYKKVNNEYFSKINKCNLAVSFGYDGNNNRIFATGNIDFPNYDFHCEIDDPTYWPDDNFTKIGTQPIISYSRIGDGTLAVHKNKSDTDCTIYYRKTNMLNNLEVFPLRDGVKNIGCISSYANSNLVNDPLFLSDEGVFATLSNSGEKYAQQRSYYVNARLLKEKNLANAVSISFQGRYYLAVNNNIYIADNRYKSYPRHADTEQYQYEWLFWKGIPVRVFFTWNNELYFGTDTGMICKFNDSYKDLENNIESYWETPFLELNNSYYSKTIKNISLTLNPNESSDITFGYSLDDGTSEIIKKEYINLTDNFPKTIQEKEKIKKFMFVKFWMKNKTDKKMTFERLILEYIIAGKYRGE